jgi:hypothetical protein
MKTLTTLIIVLSMASFATAGLQDGLVAHWTFDEGTGTIAYDSAGNNDGTIYGATWTTGKLGDALNFDGNNDYVQVPNNQSQQISTNQITVSAWIKLNGDVVNTQRRIVCKQEISNRSWGLEVFGKNYGSSTGNQTVFHDSDGSTTWYNCVSATHLNTEQWYHIVATDNAGAIRIYLNGQLDTLSNDGYGIPSQINSPINISKHNPESLFFFNGLIDDVRIYNRALSAAEVAQLYAIPEPATLILLGLGWVMLRKRQTRQVS